MKTYQHWSLSENVSDLHPERITNHLYHKLTCVNDSIKKNKYHKLNIFNVTLIRSLPPCVEELDDDDEDDPWLLRLTVVNVKDG